jgi:DNA-binding Lrp family transcriptional regulator
MSSLRPHDVAVALQLLLAPGMPYRDISQAVGISQGEAHNSVRRLVASRLVRDDRAVNANALYDFIVSGVPYAFAAMLGRESRGVPTAHSAPPFADDLLDEDSIVWPSATGQVRGASLTPLYPAAPLTARHNVPLYELLAAVDEMRIGRARERERAKAYLRDRLLSKSMRGESR